MSLLKSSTYTKKNGKGELKRLFAAILNLKGKRLFPAQSDAENFKLGIAALFDLKQ